MGLPAAFGGEGAFAGAAGGGGRAARGALAEGVADELGEAGAGLLAVLGLAAGALGVEHELAVAFVRRPGLDARLETLEQALREKFGAERAVLVLFGDPARPRIARPGFVKTVDREDPALKTFATFLRSARARCGPLRDMQKDFVFEREADSIASAAMVPIGEHASLGFLTVGSHDPNQFHPGQRVDFLGRLGELVKLILEDADEPGLRGS